MRDTAKRVQRFSKCRKTAQGFQMLKYLMPNPECQRGGIPVAYAEPRVSTRGYLGVSMAFIVLDSVHPRVRGEHSGSPSISFFLHTERSFPARHFPCVPGRFQDRIRYTRTAQVVR